MSNMSVRKKQIPDETPPEAVAPGGVTLFVGNVFHNVLHLAVEDPAKDLNGVGADAFVALEPGQLTGTDVVLLDERVLKDPSVLHNVPEIIIGNHAAAPHFLLAS